MLANDLGLDFAMIHNRHKKSLKQITPTISRKTSFIEPERVDLTGDIVSDRDNDNDPSHYEAGIAVTGTLMDSFRIDKTLQGNIHFQVF